LRFEANPGKYFARPYFKKPMTKKGLVEWLKVVQVPVLPKKQRVFRFF
jgi:hypothetical protein